MSENHNPQDVVNNNADTIETFVMGYLLDLGGQIQLVEAVARELFGQQVVVNGTVPEDTATTPKNLVSTAIHDVVNVGVFSDTEFSLQRVIDGALSFEFLVRYARKVNPAVIPPEVIPSDEAITAALELFHESKKTQVVTTN